MPPRFGFSSIASGLRGPRETLGPATGGKTQFDLTAGLSKTVGPGGTVLGDFDAGVTNTLFGASSFAEQLLNPTLVNEQQGALEAIQKTAASRGLTGGAVNVQLEQARRQFLAGNRLDALRGLQGQARSRIGAFREQISPFLALSRGSSGPLEAFRPQFEESLFGGLESLGLGGLVRQEAFRRAGGAGTQVASGAPAQLEALLGNIFRPSSVDLPPELVSRLGIEGARGARQKSAAGAVGRFLEGGLDVLENEALGLDVFSLGGSLATPEQILGADVSQFQNLLNFFAGGSFPQGPAALSPSHVFSGVPFQ